MSYRGVTISRQSGQATWHEVKPCSVECSSGRKRKEMSCLLGETCIGVLSVCDYVRVCATMVPDVLC